MSTPRLVRSRTCGRLQSDDIQHRQRHRDRSPPPPVVPVVSRRGATTAAKTMTGGNGIYNNNGVPYHQCRPINVSSSMANYNYNAALSSTSKNVYNSAYLTTTATAVLETVTTNTNTNTINTLDVRRNQSQSRSYSLSRSQTKEICKWLWFLLGAIVLGFIVPQFYKLQDYPAHLFNSHEEFGGSETEPSAAIFVPPPLPLPIPVNPVCSETVCNTPPQHSNVEQIEIDRLRLEQERQALNEKHLLNELRELKERLKAVEISVTAVPDHEQSNVEQIEIDRLRLEQERQILNEMHLQNEIKELKQRLLAVENPVVVTAPVPHCDCDDANIAIAKYDADKTGLADLALEPAGGSVVSTRCTKSSVKRSSVYTFFGLPFWSPPNNPRTIIQPGAVPGECWSYEGAEGFVVIQLISPSVVTGFTLEHIPKAVSPFGHIKSAPKDFQVVGLMDYNDPETEFVFGSYTYEDNGEPIQYFPVQFESTKGFPFIELKIQSNHGNIEYTCVYRFRVHGHFQPSNTVL